MAVFGKKKKPANDQAEAAPPVGDGAVDLPVVEDSEPQNEDLRQTSTTATQDIEYPHGFKLAALMTSAYVAMFLVSLDRLIITTAIPQITDDFHSVTDIGWYGSAYLLVNCAFQLMFGKFYTFFNVKYVFLVAIAIFEIGSAICGAAPNSIAFIIGRAVAGLGSAGIMSGVIAVIVIAVPLHKRPVYQGLFGAVFGISSIIGPLLGGAFTTKVTWRWCFYINLPFGGVAMAIILWVFTVPEREGDKLSLKDKIMQLDLFGTTLLMPGVICLLLALQWGGLTYDWNSGRIIALLVLAGLLLLGFVAVQILLPKTATVPGRILKQRSVAAGLYSTITIGSNMMIFVYFLPIYFQAIRDVSAVDSGIRLLPMVLAMVIASISSGIFIAKIGYYTPVMIFGVCIMSIGAGLLTTLQVDSDQAKWIGYQVLYGFGLGNSFQAPNLAAQTVLGHKDVNVGISLMIFGQLLGGAVFISVGQNVLDGQLVSRLAQFGFNPQQIANAGATSLAALPDAIRAGVIFQYNEALRKVFQVGLIMSCLTILGAAALEWKSVKKNKPEKDAAAEEGKTVKGEDSTSDIEGPAEKSAIPVEGANDRIEGSPLRRSESSATAHEDHHSAAQEAASAEKKETAA